MSDVNPGRQSSVERLVNRLRAAGCPITDNWAFHRTYTGPAQRAAEAWSWWIDWTDENNRRWEVGSCIPVRALLRGGVQVEPQGRRSPCSYVAEVA